MNGWKAWKPAGNWQRCRRSLRNGWCRTRCVRSRWRGCRQTPGRTYTVLIRQ
ncbi:gamma-glutamylcyclotransferase [Escherichia coli]|nr:gamma-glutamylcyclotransferase [Escherichia coli]